MRRGGDEGEGRGGEGESVGGERERVVVRGRGWRGRKAVVKVIKGGEERGEVVGR